MSTSHLVTGLVMTIVAGAAAGDVTVTGIKTTDKLVAVLDIAGTDLTDEFSITDDDTINNDGGTSSATSQLIVAYFAADARGGDLNRS